MVISAFVVTLVALQIPILYKILESDDKVLDDKKATITPDDITIVVPIKNEETNVESLVSSLLSHTTCKVILVDDYSTDTTLLKLQELVTDNDRIHILNMIRDEKSDLLAPRQAVLDFAYKQVDTKYVSVMDADIVVTKQWQDTVLKELNEKEVNFLYGYTFIEPKSAVGTIESIELFFLFSVAFGFSNLKFGKYSLPSSCMGNNITFNLQCFNDAGGYTTTGKAYNDDQAILDLFSKYYDKSAIVGSESVKLQSQEIGEFSQAINQKIRWLHDGINYNKFFIIPTLFLLLFSYKLTVSAVVVKAFFALVFSLYILLFSLFFEEDRIFKKIVLLNLYIYIAPAFYAANFIYYKFFKKKLIWKGNEV